MQDATDADRTAQRWPQATATGRSCIRARLAGSQPRHGREDWLMPGRFEPGEQRARAIAREPLPAAVLMPLVESAMS